MARRRGRALARRYGHMSMKIVEDAAASVRRLAKDNPMVSAGLGGAAVAATAAGMGVGTATLLGAAAAVGAEQLLVKK